MTKPQKGKIRGSTLGRRLSLWQHGLLRECAENKAQECGMSTAEVNPRSTSKNCSRCGLRGVRKRHSFTCPHCGHAQHADINAAYTIRNRFTSLRAGGFSSINLEAQASLSGVDVGKPLPFQARGN